ncbi:MAG: efflux RND transporter periplasmic adaptor subunit [Deltaproteobacteria bacterium]|nr:efflux RND transporter periplasmic adaptor subunit [Deltaproteobacteria bacterium]
MFFKQLEKQKYLYVMVVLIAITVIASAMLLPRSDAGRDEYLLATAVKTDFDVKVHTVGVLDASRSHMVSSSIKGDKAKIIHIVEDGAKVTQDQILARLDPMPFENEMNRLVGEVSSLEAAVEAAEQLLEWEKNQVEREIRTAEFNLKVAKLELGRLKKGDGPLQKLQYQEERNKAKDAFGRYRAYILDLEKLSQKGYANPTEIALAKKRATELQEQFQNADRKYRNYTEHVLPALIETANAKLENAHLALDQTRQGSVFKVAKSVSSLKEIRGKNQTARAALKQAQVQLEKTVIRAPISGIAILYETFRDGLKRKPRVGDRVWQNQTLLYLPDITSMIVKTQVREIDLHKLFLGQICSVSVDAFPQTVYEGKVTFIGILAAKRFERSAGEKYFQITVMLRDEDLKLRPGMTARLSILTDQVAQALTVPVQAVFSEDHRKYCYSLKDSRFIKTPVRIGKQNEDIIEILGGLKPGDQVSVVKPAPDQTA